MCVCVCVCVGAKEGGREKILQIANVWERVRGKEHCVFFGIGVFLGEMTRGGVWVVVGCRN